MGIKVIQVNQWSQELNSKETVVDNPSWFPVSFQWRSSVLASSRHEWCFYAPWVYFSRALTCVLTFSSNRQVGACTFLKRHPMVLHLWAHFYSLLVQTFSHFIGIAKYLHKAAVILAAVNRELRICSICQGVCFCSCTAGWASIHNCLPRRWRTNHFLMAIANSFYNKLRLRK